MPCFSLLIRYPLLPPQRASGEGTQHPHTPPESSPGSGSTAPWHWDRNAAGWALPWGQRLAQSKAEPRPAVTGSRHKVCQKCFQ